MKKVLILAVSLCTAATGFAQRGHIEQTNRHEIGVDATPLLKQFLFNPGGVVQSPYYILYRYHFDNWAIRARAGGYFDTDESTTNDTIVRSSEASSLRFRLGLERKIDFAKRWQFFYGVDLSADVSTSINKLDYSTNSDLSRTEKVDNRVVRYGAAPTLGFRFKLNERISLAAESSLLVYTMKGHSKYSYYPHELYNQQTDMSGTGTEFNPFTSLFFTFNF